MMRQIHEAEIKVQDERRPAKIYHGWALERVIDLDRTSPGLLAASFCFGQKRRQAMFLVLAFVEVLGIDAIIPHLRSAEDAPKFESDDPAAILGYTILRLRRPRDLVRAIVAGPPAGLLGALARLGTNPLSPRIYYELARLFLSRDPADRRRAKILGQIEGHLVGAQVEIVSRLDPVLLHVGLVSKLYEEKHVEEIHRALAYTRTYCTWASDAAIRTTLDRLRPQDHRGDLIKSWASRFDRVPHSLDTRRDPTLVVLSSAAMLVSAGLKYRNCLKSKIYDAFLGSHLFVEYKPLSSDEPGAIAELRRTNVGFILEKLYAADNRRLRADRAELIRSKLVLCGVAILDHAPGDRETIEATARMLDQWSLVQ